MEKLIFKDWESVWHVAICALISYCTLYIFIRIAGKRSLAKLNAFDFIVTVTLGSTLSSMMLAKVTLAEGVTALIILLLLQFLLAYLAMRSRTLEKVINSSPTLLFYDGRFIEDAMSKEVITHEEVYAAVREYRIHRMEDVKAVIMELNGQLSVVKRHPEGPDYSSMEDLGGEIPENPDNADRSEK